MTEIIPIDAEKWKDIPTCEGKYQISNMGRVRSLDRMNKRGYKVKGHLMTPVYNACRYTITLRSNAGVTKTFTLHVLVAKNFVPNPNNYKCVIFKDGDETNTRAENLEWRKTRVIPRKQKENKLIDLSLYRPPDQTGEQMLREIMAY